VVHHCDGEPEEYQRVIDGIEEPQPEHLQHMSKQTLINQVTVTNSDSLTQSAMACISTQLYNTISSKPAGKIQPNGRQTTANSHRSEYFNLQLMILSHKCASVTGKHPHVLRTEL